MVYNIARWYRPAWGRYSQSDPIGVNGGLNLYGYGLESPLTNVDPFGLRVQLFCHPVGAGAANPARRAVGAVGGFQHCFVRITCDACPPYDLQLEVTGHQTLNTAAIPKKPPTYVAAGNPGSIVPISPSDRDDKNCDNEECIKHRYEQLQKSGYTYPPAGFVSGPNSNTFANDLLTSCGFSVPHWPNGVTPYNPPTPPIPGFPGAGY